MTASEQQDLSVQSKPSQWSSGLVDDTTPEMGNWDEWEAFMASDQATKELDPDDAADAEDLFTTSKVSCTALPPAQNPHYSPPCFYLHSSQSGRILCIKSPCCHVVMHV